MNKISVLAVIHNEEKYLEESFNLLKPFVDEFVVIDQESTDSTIELAKKFTDKIFRFPRVYYEGAYMAHAALMAKNDWVLKCNPDERWDTKLLENLSKYIADDYDIIRFQMKYIEGNPPYSFGARLWKRNKVLWTDSFDPLPYNAEQLKQLYIKENVITNLNSCGSSLDRYRREGAKRLLARYGDTRLEPYKNYCRYYESIIGGKGV